MVNSDHTDGTFTVNWLRKMVSDRERWCLLVVSFMVNLVNMAVNVDSSGRFFHG